MKKLLGILTIAALLMMTACEKDNPTEPDPEPNGDTEKVTDNIKETPSYISLQKMENVSTFDVKFVNEGRTVGVFLNGGVSGSAGVTAKNLGAVDFDAEANLDTGFVADMDGDYVIGESWYNYDPMTHTLSSKGDVYLIKAVDYNVYKMKIDSFDSGYTISYAMCDASGKPVMTQTATIPAGDGAAGLFSLVNGAVIENDEWDIAFLTIPLYVEQLNAYIQNPGMRVNSMAGAEIAMVEGTAYDDITSVPSGLTYMKDEGDTLAVGDLLYIYNPENHRLTPPEVVYIVKTVGGKHAKVQVTSYYHPENGDSGYVNYKAEMLD